MFVYSYESRAHRFFPSCGGFGFDVVCSVTVVVVVFFSVLAKLRNGSEGSLSSVTTYKLTSLVVETF